MIRSSPYDAVAAVKHGGGCTVVYGVSSSTGTGALATIEGIVDSSKYHSMKSRKCFYLTQSNIH